MCPLRVHSVSTPCLPVLHLLHEEVRMFTPDGTDIAGSVEIRPVEPRRGIDPAQVIPGDPTPLWETQDGILKKNLNHNASL